MDAQRRLLVALVLPLSSSCLLAGCAPADQACAIEEPLFDETSLPIGLTFQGAEGVSQDDEGCEVVRQRYQIEDGILILDLHQCRTALAAGRFLSSSDRAGFPDLGPSPLTPTTWDHTMNYADGYMVGCGEREGFRCLAIGQYDEYFVQLESSIFPDGPITIDQFGGFLEAIDQRMGQCAMGQSPDSAEPPTDTGES